MTKLLLWLKARVHAYGYRLHAAEDNLAEIHGWQITETHWGLGRKYRDPRFDDLWEDREYYG